MGTITGPGHSVAQTINALFEGRRAVRFTQRLKFSHPIAYPVVEIGAHPDLDSEENTGLLRTNQLALIAVKEAIHQSGWEPQALKHQRVGVCIGSTVGCSMNNEPFYSDFKKGLHPDMGPIDRFLNNNPAALIARRYGLTGPSLTINNACASGTDAIGMACSWIRTGLCDIAIAGGADELCRVVYNGFVSLQVFSDEPCRPFDALRKGLNLGEGAGILILEKNTDKKPLGYVLGYGNACDAHHPTAPHPDGIGLRAAISQALHESGKQTSDIAFINAHGTATPDNDRVEGRVFGSLFPQTPFLSTKGLTGHTLGAAGAIEAVLTLACLQRKEIPANIGFEIQDPEIGITPATRNTAISGTIALSDSLAFGGSNSVLILEA
jgi:3-oxoacyl-[acyl-carrier-protein] synthase-1/3-oxoacyl-[acyl-carrier-protein] synthase II